MTNGDTSTVECVNGRAFKTVRRYLEFGIFEREVCYLQYLEGHPGVPKLLDWSLPNHVLVLEECGERLTKDAMGREEAERQAGDIVYRLGGFEVSHNDITPGNLMVRNGTLFLIDWQWATSGKDVPPMQWPKNLGSRWRAGDWVFDDSVSMLKSLDTIYE